MKNTFRQRGICYFCKKITEYENRHHYRFTRRCSESFFNCSIMSRAQKKGIAEIHIHNLRDYAYDRYRKVDDYPFGGFAGMVMKIEPIDRCISALKAEREYDEIIFTSPDGEQFNQPMANSLSLAKNLIILCGHF